MVFTPPPSPLPPRHPGLTQSSLDSDDDSNAPSSFTSEKTGDLTKADPPAATTPSSTPAPSSSYARIKRRLIVLFIPAILLLVGSTSSLITERHQWLHGGGPASRSSSNAINDNDTDAPVWKESFSGYLRDPALPPLVTPSHHHHLNAFSKHIHGPRTYGSGSVRDSSHPTPTLPERDTDEDSSAEEDGVAKEGQPLPHKTFPEVLAAVQGIPTPTRISNVAQQSAPAIPAVPWAVPTPCEPPSSITCAAVSVVMYPCLLTYSLLASSSRPTCGSFSPATFRLFAILQLHHLHLSVFFHHPASKPNVPRMPSVWSTVWLFVGFLLH